MYKMLTINLLSQYNTPFHCAAMNCHQEMLEHLHTTYKVEVNDRGHNKRTAMQLAARYGRVSSSNKTIDEVRVHQDHFLTCS